MSEVILTRRAERDLFSDDPLRYAVRLTDPRIGSCRFRVGDWRIVFDLVDDQVVVLRIGHRREIYRS